MKLQGKVAIVTGGASGIGRGIAARFAEEGAQVVVADRDVEGRRDWASGTSIRFIRCDVTQEDQIAALIASVDDEFGRLDVLVNNAGAPTSPAGVRDVEAADWDAGMALHLRAHVLGMKYATPVMERARSGSIVNTASIAGLQSGLGPLIYSVAKAAVIHLTKQAAVDLAPSGVRVNSVCPGWIATPIFGRGARSEEDQETIIAAVSSVAPRLQPLAISGIPSELAAAYLFLASDESRFVTGANMLVDGGLLASPAHAGAALPTVLSALASRGVGR